MRSFWYFATAISFIGILFFVFFGASLHFGNTITYTDQAPPTSPTVTFLDPALGNSNAPITMVVFGDYDCPACADFDETILNLMTDDFPNDLRIIWKDMPNTSQHPEALNAAIAARCAQEQKKFWEYHTLLMRSHTLLSTNLYTTLANELVLDLQPFTQCLEDKAPAPMIQQTYNEGVALNIATTPTVYLNGTRYTGTLDRISIKTAIRQLLAP